MVGGHIIVSLDTVLGDLDLISSIVYLGEIRVSRNLSLSAFPVHVFILIIHLDKLLL